MFYNSVVLGCWFNSEFSNYCFLPQLHRSLLHPASLRFGLHSRRQPKPSQPRESQKGASIKSPIQGSCSILFSTLARTCLGRSNIPGAIQLTHLVANEPKGACCQNNCLRFITNMQTSQHTERLNRKGALTDSRIDPPSVHTCNHKIDSQEPSSHGEE